MFEGWTAADLTPRKIWKALDKDTRQEAATAIYADPESRLEADVAICQALRFRETTIRKQPTAKRIGYLLRSVPIGEGLAGSLLLALHLRARNDMLSAFLDALEIPHEEGMIDQDYELEPPPAEKIEGAVATLKDSFDEERVKIYLASLVAMDPHTWQHALGSLGIEAPAPAE